MTSSADPNVALAARIFSDGAPYAVKLPVFEGPLDLLLHLIRLNEVEITDIPIAKVGEQYLEYLELMRELNLDVAGEYLLMAATLAWIKSRMLLPPDGDEEEEFEDPRAELVARLMEYQRFKEVAEDLGERRLLGRDVFEARGAEPDPIPDAEREVEVGLFELMEAMRHVLSKADHSGAVHEIEVEAVTVHERMIAVMEILEARDAAEFIEVLSAPDGGIPNRAVIVATFLAILELTRLAALRIYQGLDESGAPIGPIRMRRVEDGDARSWTERISDLM